VRTTGNVASTNEIMKFAKLFEDELTLDALNRQQLLALCRVLEVNTIGMTNILRFQLNMKLRNLAADDRMIQKEGIDALNLSELQSACRARGMRAYGIPEERLKSQLLEWINLSLNEKVPPSLLLLSRALMLPEDVEVSEKLKATMAVLPETIATQTKAAIGEREGKIDNKTKIEILKEEQRKIKEEEEEEKEAEAEIKAKVQQKIAEEILLDKAPIILSDSIVTPEKAAIAQASAEKELSSEDLKILTDALGSISGEKKMLIEKEEIKEIKEEIAEYEEDVEELKQIVDDQKDETLHLKESRAAKLLFKKVNSMISNLDKVLDDLETKEKEIKVLTTEPAEVTEAFDAVIEEEAKRTEELVRIDEMMSAIRKVC
jgi:LETM1 and EF-hand domain-containing protein 1